MKKIEFKCSLITLVIFALLSTTAFAAPMISDYAGTGEPGYGDGKLLESKLNQPWGLTVDQDGNLIIVDSANHTIRKVVDNEITTLAGMTEDLDVFGLPLGGHVDEDAAKAMFNQPRYAVVDAEGDLYISDSQNHAIRKISNGKVFTYAGTGEAGYKDGDRTTAQFNSPAGLAIDKAGNLYVADTLNHVIRKIDNKGNVTTYAGKYVVGDGAFLDGALNIARFQEPNDLVFDDKGNLYVSDSGNHLIRMIAGDKVSTFAGETTARNEETGYMVGGYSNGKKENALFNFPKGLAYADGILFIADSLNNRIRAVKENGTVINLVGKSTAGDVVGQTDQSMLFQPIDVFYHKGSLFVSDLYNNKIKKYELDTTNLVAIQNVDDIMAGIELLPVTEDVQVWFDYTSIAYQTEQPLIKDDKVYLPVRSTFESWGATVDWLDATKEIQLSNGNWKVNFVLDAKSMLVIDGRTYVELKQLAQITHFFVEWVEDYRAVLIDSID